MIGLVQQICVKSALCSPEAKEHYRACLAAAEVISKHNLEQELAEQFFKTVTFADCETLNTKFKGK